MSSKYRVYPEYKDSGVEWLGDVPNHWDEVRLKYVASLIVEKIEAGSTQIYIGLENIQPGNGKYLAKEDMNPEGLSTAFYQGDVLFGKLRPYLSKSWLADFSGICSSEFLVLRSRKVCSKFLSYYTLMGEFVNQVDSSTYGSKMPRASWDFISLMAVPVPLQEESVKIANFLDHETAKIDTLIDKQQQLIALLKEKRQAVISHAVTKGLNPDAPMKDSGVEWLGRVPKHWEIVMLGKKIQLHRGIDITKDQQSEGEIPVVSSGGISSYHNQATCRGPGVVIGRKGTAGKMHYIDTDFWAHDTTLYVKEFRGNIPRFVFYKLLAMHLETYDTGSANPTLNRNNIHPVKVSWCPIEDQLVIVEFLDRFCLQAEKIVDKVNCAIGILQERRTAIISAAVTGKIDVRNWRPPIETQVNKDTP